MNSLLPTRCSAEHLIDHKFDYSSVIGVARGMKGRGANFFHEIVSGGQAKVKIWPQKNFCTKDA